MTDPLRVVDAHIHVWDLATGFYPHFEAPSDGFVGNNAAIARSYLLSELRAEGAGKVIADKLVHVEAFPTDRIGETAYLQALVRLYQADASLLTRRELEVQ